jgi:cytochrome c oxidase cbb3-type subunit 3
MIFLKRYSIPVTLLLLMAMPYAGIAAGPPRPSELNNPLAITLVVVIVGLLLAIGGLAYVVLSAAQMYLQRFKEVKHAKEGASLAPKITGMLLLCLVGMAAHAEEGAADTVAAQVSAAIGGLSPVSFYTLISVIALELLVLFV